MVCNVIVKMDEHLTDDYIHVSNPKQSHFQHFKVVLNIKNELSLITSCFSF